VIAAPVGTGHLHQLEDLQFGRRRHVRAAAKINEIAFTVQRNLLIGRNGANQLSLVLFTHAKEEVDRIVPRPDFTDNRYILLASSAMRFSMATKSSV
jgi:hypothetical protein